jgi:hypothetical protein
MDQDKPWLERPRSIRLMWIGFAAVLALTVVAEALAGMHGRFGIDDVFAFNAWYGFASCVALVVVAKLLGPLLKRPERHYED